MKIVLYHPFQNLPDNYSLSHVCVEQLLMLTERDIETYFFTSNTFKAKVPTGVIVHDILPYSGAKGIYNIVKPLIKDMDAVFTHDIRISPSFTDHLVALRRIAEEVKTIKWLHWVHSAADQFAGVGSEQRKPFPRSIYVAMNKTDIPKLAGNLKIPEGYCRAIYNSVSPDKFFDMHPLTAHLIKKYKLLDCDVLITYPLDTGRFKSKGGHKVIKLVEGFRKNNFNAKVVFANAASNNPKRRKLTKNIRKGKEDYIIFTSLETDDVCPKLYYYNSKGEKTSYHMQVEHDWDDVEGRKRKGWGHAYPSTTTHTHRPNGGCPMIGYPYEVYVPRRVVRELFQISNVFPLLSDSEGCSLTLLEAVLARNLIVLNADFPPLLEFGGHITGTFSNIFVESDYCLYMKVGSVRQQTKHNPSEEAYYSDWSRFIMERLGQSRVLKFNRKILSRFNRDWIWANMIEPILQ